MAADWEISNAPRPPGAEQNATLTSVAAKLGSVAAGIGLDPDGSEAKELAERILETALCMRSYDESDPCDGPRGKNAIKSIIERQYFTWGFDNPRELSKVETSGRTNEDEDRVTDRDGQTRKNEQDTNSGVWKANRVKLSWVKPKRIDWLWPDRIARGALNVLVGDPGQGKSQLTCDIARRRSRFRAVNRLASAQATNRRCAFLAMPR